MNALSWLAKRLAWEQRLTELRIERNTPKLPASQRSAGARMAPKATPKAA